MSKQKIQQSDKQPPEPKGLPKSTSSIKPHKKLVSILSVSIFLFSVMLYANTFNHHFVFDDHGIIKENAITNAQVSWNNTKQIFTTPYRFGYEKINDNTLYRPITKLIFNLEWNLFGGNPNGFHLVNVFLYALLGLMLFIVLYNCSQKKWVMPFAISLLFIAHPIHTEVVDNIKSLDEIISLLCILGSLRCIQVYAKDGKPSYLVVMLLLFCIALFSKESSVAAVLLFPLFIYFFTTLSFRKNFFISALFLICAFFFIACRGQIVHEMDTISSIDNYLVLCNHAPFEGTTSFASAVSNIGMYLKVFLFPLQLQSDYSFPFLTPIDFTNWKFIVSFIALISMLIFSIWKLKSKQLISFGLLWFFIAIGLTSNVFFLIGTAFGERLLFMPSLGLCIALVAALDSMLVKEKEREHESALLKSVPLFSGILLLALCAFSIQTIIRNQDWKSDHSLFSSDYKKNPNSFMMLYSFGNSLTSKEFTETLQHSIEEQNLAIDFKDTLFKANRQAIGLFQKATSLFPIQANILNKEIGVAYLNMDVLDSAKKYYLLSYGKDSSNPVIQNALGGMFYNSVIEKAKLEKNCLAKKLNDSVAYYRNMELQNLIQANNLFVKAYLQDSSNTEYINNIGSIYVFSRQTDNIIYWFEKTLSIDAHNVKALTYLERTYRTLGNQKQADAYKATLDAANVQPK